MMVPRQSDRNRSGLRQAPMLTLRILDPTITLGVALMAERLAFGG